MINKKEIKNKEQIIAHSLLIFFFIGVLIYYLKNKGKFSEENIIKIRKTLNYSIKMTICLVIFIVMFLISPMFFGVSSLYVFLSILLPAFLLFYVIIYIVGLTELKQGRNFIYPFVG